jgi:hypothetical protein
VTPPALLNVHGLTAASVYARTYFDCLHVAKVQGQRAMVEYALWVIAEQSRMNGPVAAQSAIDAYLSAAAFTVTGRY